MRFLARALATLIVVLVLPSLVAAFLLPGQDYLVVGIFFGLLAIGSAVTGYLVATRVPASLIGWLLLAQGIGMALALAWGETAALGLHHSSSPATVYGVCGWGADLLVRIVVVIPTGVLLLVFPTGRFQSRAWVAFAALFVLVLTAAGVTGMLLVDSVGPGIDNPFRVHGAAADVVHVLREVSLLAAVPVAIGCVVSLFLRLRQTHGAERQRVKWIAYTAAVAVVGFGVALVVGEPWGDLAWLVALLCVVLLPVSMGVAILRHRLFDIDVVIKRTLVYSILTLTLLTTYLLLVLLLQVLLRPRCRGLRPCRRRLDAGRGGAVRPVAPPRAGSGRPPVLPFAVRRRPHSRCLRRAPARRGGPVRRSATTCSSSSADTMQPEHVSLWLRKGLLMVSRNDSRTPPRYQGRAMTILTTSFRRRLLGRSAERDDTLARRDAGGGAARPAAAGRHRAERPAAGLPPERQRGRGRRRARAALAGAGEDARGTASSSPCRWSARAS